MQEHAHVISLLKDARIAARNGDIMKLKQLSDQTIHASAIYQDTDNILVAVVIYSLSKLIERRGSYNSKEFNDFFNYYTDTIDFSIKCIKNDKCDLFRKRIEELTKKTSFAADIRKSAEAVFKKARINKASKVYEHGISMQATAKLLGVSLWELAEYTGQTSISDTKYNRTFDVKMRIKRAMEMFR